MYRYTLLNKNRGRYVLQNDPIGWDANRYNFKRSQKLHGVTIEYTTELEFVKDALDYIQAVYEAEGVEGEIGIIIEDQNMDLRWEREFAGALNLDNYEIGDVTVKTNIEQDGFTQRFLNGDELEINLQKLTTPLGEPMLPFANETIGLTLHSKVISRGFYAKVLPDLKSNESDLVDDSNKRDATIIMGFSDIVQNDMKAYDYPLGFSFDGNVFPLFPRAVETGPLEINIKLRARVAINLIQGDFDEAAIQFFYRVNEGPATILFSETSNKAGGDFVRDVYFDFITTEEIKLGDQIYFWGRVFGGDTAGAYRWRYKIDIDTNDTFIKVSALTQTGATATQGMMAHEVGARLTEAITGVPDSFVSNFLGRTDSQPRKYEKDGEGSMLFFANGFQIRNFPYGERPVTMTYKKWYEGLDAIHGLGTGIEIIEGKERVRVEKREHFYQKEVVLTLGKVTGLKKRYAGQYAFNQAEFGYTKWQTGSDNGLDEFNTKRAYALPLTKSKNKYSAISNFIASGYSIETTRREQYTLATNKDNSNDDEIYVICVLREGSAFVTERNQLFSTLNGVISPETVYNARISPARMLQNHGGILKAGLLHQLDKYIKFTTGEANYKMASQLASESILIAENRDFLIAQLPDPINMPEEYRFTYALQPHETRTLRKNPYGMIQFEDAFGNIKQGHVLEANVSKLESSEFTVLRRFE